MMLQSDLSRKGTGLKGLRQVMNRPTDWRIEKLSEALFQSPASIWQLSDCKGDLS
jgi:hypothetical protein